MHLAKSLSSNCDEPNFIRNSFKTDHCNLLQSALCYSIDWSISFKVHLNNFAAEHSTRFKNNARALHAMLQIQ